MNVEKVFNPEAPDEFSAEDLLIALPRAIVKEQRIYHLEFQPSIKDDNLEFITLYRCESNSTVFGVSAPSPKASLLSAANWLLKNEIIVSIKKYTNG